MAKRQWDSLYPKNSTQEITRRAVRRAFEKHYARKESVSNDTIYAKLNRITIGLTDALRQAKAARVEIAKGYDDHEYYDELIGDTVNTIETLIENLRNADLPDGENE